MPGHAVFESRSNKGAVIIDANTKIIIDFNEVILTKNGVVVPIFFVSEYQCITASNLLKLCRYQQGNPPDEVNIRIFFEQKVRSVGFKQQVCEEDMIPESG